MALIDIIYLGVTMGWAVLGMLILKLILMALLYALIILIGAVLIVLSLGTLTPVIILMAGATDQLF